MWFYNKLYNGLLFFNSLCNMSSCISTMIMHNEINKLKHLKAVNAKKI